MIGHKIYLSLSLYSLTSLPFNSNLAIILIESNQLGKKDVPLELLRHVV